jgi:excisionase family DNA binding protein
MSEAATAKVKSTGRFLKVSEAAAELNVSERSAWALISTGHLAAIRHGARCTRIARESLEAYLASLQAK